LRGPGRPSHHGLAAATQEDPSSGAACGSVAAAGSVGRGCPRMGLRSPSRPSGSAG
jgi:hypothetical protein